MGRRAGRRHRARRRSVGNEQRADHPAVRGKLKAGAPLAPLVWFKSGGNAEWLFEPADRDDLVRFLKSSTPRCR